MTDLPEFNNANFYATRDPFEAVAGKQGDTTPVGFCRGKHYTEPASGPVWDFELRIDRQQAAV